MHNKYFTEDEAKAAVNVPQVILDGSIGACGRCSNQDERSSYHRRDNKYPETNDIIMRDTDMADIEQVIELYKSYHKENIRLCRKCIIYLSDKELEE